jgi:hypothetical protein
MEIECGDRAWGTRWFRVVFESLVWDLYGNVSFYALLLLHRKPELLPCLFSYPLEVRPLKAAYSW